MQYKLGFEYVSIAISIIILFLFKGKRKASLPIYQKYYVMMILALMASVFDVLSIKLMGHEALFGEGAVYLVNIIYLGCLNALPANYIICILHIVNIDYEDSNIWTILILTPVVTALSLLICTPVTGYIFYVDENLAYTHGPGFYMLIVLLFFQVIVGVVAIFKYSKNLGRIKMFYTLFFVVMTIGAQIIQMVYGEVIIVCLAAVLAMCVVIYMTQSPDEIFDSTGAMFAQSLFEGVEAEFGLNHDFAVYLIKMNQLELLEDSFGEDEMDELLKSVTRHLTSLHPTAMVYRVEHDIYALKVRRMMIDSDELADLQNQILIRFDEPWRQGEMELVLPIGLVCLRFPQDAKNMDAFYDLINKAARVQIPISAVWTSRDLEVVDKEEEILRAVRNAMTRNGLQVFYQPIYSVKEDRVVAAEALVRLFDAEMGFISPEVFIPLAEKKGLILDVGRFVFQEVCHFVSSHPLAELDIRYIEVNLSPVQCMQYELADEFVKIMEQNHIAENQIKFEITETSKVGKNPIVASNIHRFVHYGIDFSLDDYGTGYSNLDYLSDMPFRYLKIDKSLLWSADKNRKADLTLKNTIEMSRRLNIQSIVEGVETQKHVDKLRALGVDFFQGYYYSKPINGENFLRYVNSLRT